MLYDDNWLFDRLAIDRTNHEVVVKHLMSYGVNPIDQRGNVKPIGYILRELLQVMDRSQVRNNINSFYKEYECRWIGGQSISKDDIKNVYFNPEKKTTVIKWKDSTITKVKCQNGDKYNKETGLAMCISKKAMGNKGNYNDVFSKWI